jgi:DNA polymerase-3 subunit epsilon
MKTKIFWMDIESTGLSAKDNDIIQLAVIVDINGAVEDRKFWEICPINPLTISQEALEINGLSKEAILLYRPASEIFKELINFLNRYVDRFNKQDKFLVAGYNVNFDIQFLREFFNKMGHKYYGSYFKNNFLDVMAMSMLYSFISGVAPLSFKLANVAELFRINETNFHSASADINATREIFYKLLAVMKEKNQEAF